MNLQPLQPYPSSIDPTIQSLVYTIQKLAQIRQNDQLQWNNLKNNFIAGRSVTRIPTSSTNVLATDNVGDYNVTPTYAYFLVNNSGTIEWVRTALSTF